LLSFTCGGSTRSINRGNVLEVLGLGPPLTDLTQVGKMKDCYLLTIMRIENIIALIEQDATAEAAALLPLPLCLSATRLETITTETRNYMLRVSLFLVWELYQARKDRNKRDQWPEKPSAGAEKITIFRSQWSECFLDTLLLLTSSIRKYPHFTFDRLSTHLLEHSFGLIMVDSHGMNTLGKMMITIAHADIVKRADVNLGIEETVRQRANLAWVHIGDPSLDGRIVQIDLPENFEPEEVARICLTAVHAGIVTLSPGEQTSYDLFV
jgi:hypothetical protein